MEVQYIAKSRPTADPNNWYMYSTLGDIKIAPSAEIFT